MMVKNSKGSQAKDEIEACESNVRHTGPEVAEGG